MKTVYCQSVRLKGRLHLSITVLCLLFPSSRWPSVHSGIEWVKAQVRSCVVDGSRCWCWWWFKARLSELDHWETTSVRQPDVKAPFHQGTYGCLPSEPCYYLTGWRLSAAFRAPTPTNANCYLKMKARQGSTCLDSRQHVTQHQTEMSVYILLFLFPMFLFEWNICGRQMKIRTCRWFLVSGFWFLWRLCWPAVIHQNDFAIW